MPRTDICQELIWNFWQWDNVSCVIGHLPLLWQVLKIAVHPKLHYEEVLQDTKWNELSFKFTLFTRHNLIFRLIYSCFAPWMSNLYFQQQSWVFALVCKYSYISHDSSVCVVWIEFLIFFPSVPCQKSTILLQ